VTGWILLSGKELGGSDVEYIVTDAATPPGGKGQPAALRSAGEGGWGRRAPWTGILARPAASMGLRRPPDGAMGAPCSFPATFPGRSRLPHGLNLTALWAMTPSGQ